MRAIREFSMKNTMIRSFAAPFLTAVILLTVASACGELTGPKSPSTPTGVTATLLSGTSVLVTWTPSPLNDGVVGYSIYRNGTKVGESATTSFTDTGLPQQQVFKYTVAANCTAGIISDQSAESDAATVTTLDVTPPRVASTSPANGQSGVSSSATVTATFSEPIDPTTINTTTFLVKVTSSGVAVPGTVTYTAATRIAEFKPTGALPNPGSITATVTTGVKDLAGNRVAADFSWAFTTRDDSPPTVISTSPANGATSVPPASPITVTFSEAMDATTITNATITLKATSSGLNVNGTVSYNTSTHIATFIPNAALSQTTGYTLTVAAGVKDLAGNQMGTPFSMSFTTGDTVPPTVLAVSPTNLATGVSPSATVQVAFSEPMTESTITTSTIFLTNTSTSAIVPATVAYNSATNTATLTPSASLPGSTTFALTVTTGVKDLSGNSLATTFNSVFTTAVVDTTAPTVTAVSPANLATNVPTNTTVQVTFSEAMDSTTMTNTNVTLKVTTTSALVPAVVVYNKATHVATLTPSSALAFATGYTVTVTTGVKDAAGNALASPFSSTFTTAAAPDTTAPTILSRTPANGATGVATTVAPTVTFSEPMDTTTINSTNIRLSVTSTSAAVAGTVSYNTATNTATFTPTSPLSNSTGYTLTVTTGVKDVAGNALAAQSTSTFTTVADTTSPTVVTTSPLNNATNVAATSPVTVTFSEDMDAATIVSPANNIKLNVTTGGAVVAGTVTYNAATRVATFTPTSPLAANTNYTATITTGVKDLAGNPLALTQSFTFTTAP
jgi:Big-like domain-containing protein/fibronectin type III domain protein